MLALRISYRYQHEYPPRPRQATHTHISILESSTFWGTMLFPSTLYILASARVAPFLVVGASPCGPEDSAAPAENNNGHEKIVTVTVTVEATSSAVVPHKPWEDNQQGSEPGNGHNTGKLSSPAPTWSSQSSSSTSGHSESSVTTSRPLLPVEMLTWRCNTFLSPGNPQQIPTSTSTSVVTITLTSTITPTTTVRCTLLRLSARS